MNIVRLVLLSTASAGLALSAPAREIVELQREVAALQEQVRTLQRALDEKMSALTTLVQQSLDSSSKGNTSIAVLESGIRDRMAEQQKTLVAPVAAMSAKVDQMATEFQSVRDSVADLGERMNRLQTQLVDVSNTVKTLQAPPAPPSGTSPGASMTGGPAIGGGGAADLPAPVAPPPGLSAKQLYDSATKDRSGGNLDLALQGFQEYLKYFGNTELAPNAQFYIGQIHYDRNDFANAISAFDVVLERFPDNSKTPDAMYMKGMALLRSNQRNAAATEFANVIQRYPNAEVTVKARNQRKALGLSANPAGAAPAKRRRG